MTEKLKQTIEEQIKLLPREGQEAIASVSWLKITEEIGKKHSLLETEVEDFQLETLLLLIGATELEFYAINIENQADLIKETAEDVAEEAFKKILLPIRKKIEENIKNNLIGKNPDWKQTLYFVLSGGNYFAYLERTEIESTSSTQPTNTQFRTSKVDSLKNKFTI